MCEIKRYDTIEERRYQYNFFIKKLLKCNKKNRTNSIKTLKPADIIIIEGVLSFFDDYLRSIYNIKIFLDTDEDTRLSRRGFY